MQNYNRIAGMADFGKVAVFFVREKGRFITMSL